MIHGSRWTMRTCSRCVKIATRSSTGRSAGDVNRTDMSNYKEGCAWEGRGAAIITEDLGKENEQNKYYQCANKG